MLLFLFIIPMWGIVFGAAFVVLSYVLSQRENRIIGHEAHLGGAVVGIVTTLLVEPRVWTSFLAQIAEKFG
jgi:membrane associated rhomboid family serine protease